MNNVAIKLHDIQVFVMHSILPIPACPTTQEILMNSMTPQMLRRHLVNTPWIQPSLMELPSLSSVLILGVSSLGSLLFPDRISAIVGRALLSSCMHEECGFFFGVFLVFFRDFLGYCIYTHALHITNMAFDFKYTEN